MQFKSLKKIKFILFKKFGVKTKDIKLNSKIFNQIIFDSLDILEFIVILEKSFEIEISESFNFKNKTVKQLLNYINNKKINNGI